MVWIVNDSRDQWPGVDNWLKNDFRKVFAKKKVMDAFYKWWKPPEDAPIPGITNNPDYYRMASNDQADFALRYGSSPSIQIMSMGCRTTNPGSNEKQGTRPPGMMYAMTFKSGIILSQDVAALVEFVKSGKFPKFVQNSDVIDILKQLVQKMPAQAILDFAEQTILHEMIHWRHWVLGLEAEVTEGKKDYITTKYGDDEAPSYAFEREAYGAVATLPIQVCVKSNTDH